MTSRTLHLVLVSLVFCFACVRPMRETAPVGELPVASPRPSDTVATRLGSGDLFEVRVYQETELSGLYRVGTDGAIDFPFCGRLDVRAKTSSEVAVLVRDCLKAGYLKNPEVTVTAREYNSKRIYLYGQVQKPGPYPYQDELTVVEAVAGAGGFTSFAGQNKVRVTRGGAEGEKQFEVPVSDISTGKAPNFYLLPGDVVFVPESWI